ncbi:MAG: acyl-CoA dehydrogenase C-terminal domain-containing protein [Pseudomonadales bacterium]
MLQYEAPIRDAEFVLFDLFRVQDRWARVSSLEGFTPELVRAVLGEAGRLAAEVMAPLNQTGDREGARLEQGRVVTPVGFASAFSALAQGGWLGLAGNPLYGGQGMPKALGGLVEEMFWAANSSLFLYGTLTVGAAICIEAHGSPEQQALYLPKLYAGEWTGVMALTEAHAGSDLGLMRTRAEPHADGSYRLSGTKIFITSGDHDLASNIVHLVLARLPDAPAGTRGISLFIVPKFVPDAAGALGARNAFAPSALEHKMGIHASATCVMNYDGATGYLLGAPHQGLAAMFTMMNYERLSVGLQGLGAGEIAGQQALRYARERLQGRGPVSDRAAVADPLLAHPDVRRMLLTVRALTEGGRAFGLMAGIALDRARHEHEAAAEARAELLTPLAKAFLTDRGFECAVIAQQVFGGHGFVREWGAEQLVRDARIAQIYEGTNGIQAMDFVGRKVLRDGGAALRALLDELAQEPVASAYASSVADAFARLRSTTAMLVERSAKEPSLAGAVATDYLDLVGYTLFGWLWGRMAALAPDDDFGAAKRQTAEFFFARLLPRTLALEASVCSDQGSVTAPLCE